MNKKWKEKRRYEKFVRFDTEPSPAAVETLLSRCCGRSVTRDFSYTALFFPISSSLSLLPLPFLNVLRDTLLSARHVAANKNNNNNNKNRGPGPNVFVSNIH